MVICLTNTKIAYYHLKIRFDEEIFVENDPAVDVRVSETEMVKQQPHASIKYNPKKLRSHINGNDTDNSHTHTHTLRTSII